MASRSTQDSAQKTFRELEESLKLNERKLGESLKFSERIMASYKREQTDLEHKLVEVQAQLPTLCRFPNNILRTVFLFTLDDGGSQEPITPRTSPISMLQVCHKWRQVALDCPALFTTIRISTDFKIHLKRIVELFLAQSGSLPLHIILHKPKSLASLGEFRVEQYDTLRGYLGPISQHIDRVESLSVVFGPYLDVLFPQGRPQTVHFQNLSLLEFTCAVKDRFSASFSPVVAPRLRQFRASWNVSSSQLEASRRIDSLTYVELEFSDTANPNLTVHHCESFHYPLSSLITVLSNCSNLQEITFSINKVDLQNPDGLLTSSIFLPQLRTFVLAVFMSFDETPIRDFTGLCHILKAMRAPNLQTLTLKNHVNSEASLPLFTELVDGLITQALICGTSLTSLALHGLGCVPAGELLGILRRLPKLERLVVKQLSLVFCQASMWEYDQSLCGLCPQLKYLTLDKCGIPGNLLLASMESRLTCERVKAESLTLSLSSGEEVTRRAKRDVEKLAKKYHGKFSLVML